MPYLGVAPNPRQNREVDDISSGFNGGTTQFTLQSGGSNVSPGSDTAIIVSLGGVVQNPGTDYTIAASTITFTTAPASGLSFFGVVLAQSIDIETTADGTVTTAKIVDGAITNAKVNASAAIAASKIADFVTGNTNNRVLTATGTANSLNGEASLTFDGSTLVVTPTSSDARVTILGSEGNDARLSLISDDGDDHIDQYNLRVAASNNRFYIDQFESGAFQERFTIANGGNVGIGDSSPDAPLVVRGSTSAHTVFKVNSQSESTKFSIQTVQDSDIRIGTQSNHPLAVYTNQLERMRIDNSGRVGIGVTSLDAQFNVHNNAATRVPVDINDTNNTSTLTHRLRFLTGGTEVGRIRSSSSATVYDTSASDITLKKNFEDWTENTLDLFKNINPQKFNYIQEEDTAEKSKGFIAQEMVDSFPEAYTKEDKEDSKYFFNPSGMVVYLMKAIQELEAKVAALEAA